MDLFDLDLTKYGAPGYKLTDRLDLTGHRSGRVDPHINSEVCILGVAGRNDFVVRIGSREDLVHNQLPGFNGMQKPAGICVDMDLVRDIAARREREREFRRNMERMEAERQSEARREIDRMHREEQRRASEATQRRIAATTAIMQKIERIEDETTRDFFLSGLARNPSAFLSQAVDPTIPTWGYSGRNHPLGAAYENPAGEAAARKAAERPLPIPMKEWHGPEPAVHPLLTLFPVGGGERMETVGMTPSSYF